MHRSRRAVTLIAFLACVTAVLAACSSTGGAKSANNAAVNLPHYTFALVTHAVPGDTFWDLVRKGAQDAAAKDNVTLKYSSDPNAGNQATLVQNAIDSKVDGIAVTLAKPDAMRGAVAAAKSAGIPVVGLNDGIDYWKQLGLLEYFGSDESLAGTAFGQRLNQVGAKHALCVIQEQGNVALETRCAALAKAFTGKTDILYVNSQDMSSVQSTMTAKLQQDPSIDYVVTLGAPEALTAVQSVQSSGSKAKIATFDTNKQLVGAIQSGQVQWAVDQQPYLQGYLAIDGLWLYKTNGDISGGGSQPVLTGPSFVDSSNIASVAKYAAAGTR
ncbi:MAG TPA: substrate-binding domain-containing protein [Pseudonocardiaceae bacterium]|jgi:simple sugar transport system substrate-binding protein|nr:substrate-binding domain-containing protein [Pseudonocardiaceae bacterium]